MIDPLSVALGALAVLGAIGSLALAVLDRRVNWPLFGVLVALEAGLLAQLGIGVVRLAGADRDVSGATFVGYLVAAVLVVPVGLFWTLAEHSRWGTAVLALACLVAGVLVLRLDQVWSGG